jgi:hypothetical protein
MLRLTGQHCDPNQLLEFAVDRAATNVITWGKNSRKSALNSSRQRDNDGHTSANKSDRFIRRDTRIKATSTPFHVA